MPGALSLDSHKQSGSHRECEHSTKKQTAQGEPCSSQQAHLSTSCTQYCTFPEEMETQRDLGCILLLWVTQASEKCFRKRAKYAQCSPLMFSWQWCFRTTPREGNWVSSAVSSLSSGISIFVSPTKQMNMLFIYSPWKNVASTWQLVPLKF